MISYGIQKVSEGMLEQLSFLSLILSYDVKHSSECISVVLMIDSNKQLFIHPHRIDDRRQCSEPNIIEKKKITEDFHFYLTNTNVKDFLFTFSYKIMLINHLQTKALKSITGCRSNSY